MAVTETRSHTSMLSRLLFTYTPSIAPRLSKRLALSKFTTTRVHTTPLYTYTTSSLNMPRKKAAAPKRKRPEPEEESEVEATTSEVLSDAGDSDAPSSSKPKAKKTKLTKPKATKATKADRPVNDQPTNKVLPSEIEFPAKNEGCVRIATWNICGLASAEKKVR